MVIGVDLGGTQIRAGLEDNGRIIHTSSVILREKDSLTSTLDQLKNLIRQYNTFQATAIGIGVPSVVDLDQGVVYNVINIPSWERVELKSILEEEFGLPVYINNDANCFILGEWRFGVANGYKSIVGLSIGTGLGAGLVIDGELYVGNNCGAGEIGLLPYLKNNYEYYLSGATFEEVYGISPMRANELAGLGDSDSVKVWEQYGEHLGQAIMAVMYTYDPEMIVLGGSLSKAFPFFNKSMYNKIKEFAFPETTNSLLISQSENDNIALLGAAALIPRNGIARAPVNQT
jgi:glucokinase